MNRLKDVLKVVNRSRCFCPGRAGKTSVLSPASQHRRLLHVQESHELNNLFSSKIGSASIGGGYSSLRPILVLNPWTIKGSTHKKKLRDNSPHLSSGLRKTSSSSNSFFRTDSVPSKTNLIAKAAEKTAAMALCVPKSHSVRTWARSSRIVTMRNKVMRIEGRIVFECSTKDKETKRSDEMSDTADDATDARVCFSCCVRRTTRAN